MWLEGGGEVRLLGVLCRAKRMSWEDRRETVIALWLAVVVEIGLRTLRLPRMARLLGVRLDTANGASTVPAVPDLPPWAQTRLRAVARVARRWPTSTCLRRSLLMGQRLRALDPGLRIGVRRDAGEMQAHAWLEVGGVSLDVEAQDFSPLAARIGAPETG